MTTTYKPSRKILERRVRKMVALGSGLPPSNVIPGNENNPKPSDSFAVLTLLSDDRIGFPYYRYDDHASETSEVIWESRRAEYQIMFFGDELERANVLEYPQNLQMWIVSTDGVLEQHRLDIVFHSHTDIRQADHHADIWESRASMDVVVTYKRVSSRDVGWIDKVDILVHHRDNPSIDETIMIRPPEED